MPTATKPRGSTGSGRATLGVIVAIVAAFTLGPAFFKTGQPTKPHATAKPTAKASGDQVRRIRFEVNLSARDYWERYRAGTAGGSATYTSGNQDFDEHDRQPSNPKVELLWFAEGDFRVGETVTLSAKFFGLASGDIRHLYCDIKMKGPDGDFAPIKTSEWFSRHPSIGCAATVVVPPKLPT